MVAWDYLRSSASHLSKQTRSLRRRSLRLLNGRMSGSMLGGSRSSRVRARGRRRRRSGSLPGCWDLRAARRSGSGALARHFVVLVMSLLCVRVLCLRYVVELVLRWQIEDVNL